jgi:hypothetical protein
MNRFHVRVNNALAALTLLLGSLALYAQACLLARASFATLRTFSFLPLLLAGFLLAGFLLIRTFRVGPLEAMPSEPRRTTGGPARRGAIWFGTPFAIAALYAITHSEWLFWLLAASYLTAVTWFHGGSQSGVEAPDPPESRLEIGVLLALCALAAILTAGTNRPDADDGYYVNVANAVVEFPDRVPQSFDALHRDGLPPVEQMLHPAEVYEILVGLLSSISGASVKTLYYIVLPPLWAVLATLAHWLLLRRLLRRRGAIWGTAIFVFLLVFWGDGHRTFGNFGFVRLFHGKAIYLTAALPLILLASLRYRERPGAAAWLGLALSQCAAAGLTTTGVVVAPLAAALVLVARPRFDARSLRTMLTGLAASVPLVAVAAANYTRMGPFLSGMNIDAAQPAYPTTLGAVRAPLVLLALLLLPALAASAGLKSSDWITGYVWIVVLVIFMPAVLDLASLEVDRHFSWRLFWAVPMPLLVSLAGGIAAGAAGARHWRVKGVLAAWVVAFAIMGPAAVSGGNFSLKNLGRLKVVDAPYDAAEATVALARPDALALVAEPVAVYVAGFPHAPPLVGVRKIYLSKLRGLIHDEELTSRIALFDYSGGANEVMTVGGALEAIDGRRIATVVFPERHRDAAALAAALTRRGFAIHPVRGYVISTRPK